jgi:hypothetical protein
VEYAVIAFFCGLSAGVIGRIKGGSFLLWTLIGLCLPLLGTLAAIFWRWENREGRRQCPTCGNVVPLHDQVCMRCGEDLDWPEEEPDEAPVHSGVRR